MYLNIDINAYTGGLSTSAVVKVDVQDVNDNWPVFSPSEYNVSIVWSPDEQGPIVAVRAKDLDSGSFGVVSYYLLSAKGIYKRAMDRMRILYLNVFKTIRF